MNAEQNMQFPLWKPSVILTGTAKKGKAGPPLGLVDIGISESAYLFRVSLPGIRHNQCDLTCNVHVDGRVQIKGVVTGSDVLRTSSTAFEMKVEQLSPPGAFSICFRLPGPVDTRLSSQNFRPDGILEVVVMKFRMKVVSVGGPWVPPS